MIATEESVEDDADQAGRPTLVCESFDCQTWEGSTKVQPKLVPMWLGSRATGAWFYCCSKCKASYGQRPHPSLPDLTFARLAR